MIRITWLIVLMLSISMSYAQSPTPAPVCGSGIPCGPIPWRLPDMPIMSSPTPMADVSANTIIPTPDSMTEDDVDFSSEQDVVQGLIDATPIVIDGFDQETEQNALIGEVGIFMGIVAAIRTSDLAVLNPLIIAFFAITFLTLLLKMSVLIMPIVALIIGIIRKVIQLLPFT